jgi:uncharacterized membrane protein YczE
MSASTRTIVIVLLIGSVIAFVTPYILQPEGWPLPAAAFAAVGVFLVAVGLAVLIDRSLRRGRE